MVRVRFQARSMILLAVAAAVFAGCFVQERTGTLSAKVDNLPEVSKIRIENTTGRDWEDVTFTMAKVFTYHHDKVPAGSIIEIPYEEFKDEDGESFDPEVYAIRLWIATPEEYWGMH